MRFTDFGECKMADYMRGQSLPVSAAWYIAPGTAASDSGFTELTGSGVARFAMTRNLTNWAGTQGAGTTLASTGTSHVTSNNVAINMGTAAGAYGTATHIGFFDAASGGNCWIWAPLITPIVTAAAVPLLVPIEAAAFSLGLAGGMSNYLSNKLIDLLFRGQAYSWPASLYLRAMTAAPSNAGGGTEVGGGVGYARMPIASSLAAWSGTQGPGSTSASSGTLGRISNNAQIAFPEPSGSWGAIGWGALNDAASVGNLMWWAPLAAAKTVGPGVPLVFAADAVGITWD